MILKCTGHRVSEAGGRYNDELSDLPDCEPQVAIEIGELHEAEEVDGSWRSYRSGAHVPFEFASKEMDEEPEEYDYDDYDLGIDFYINPDDMWAKCELDRYGELSPDQIDLSSATLQGMSLSSFAIGAMLARHEDFADDYGWHAPEVYGCI